MVYLHCWGGRGRAGTVGATLLHRLYGLPAEEALERVQRAYSTRKDPERAPAGTPFQLAPVFVCHRSAQVVSCLRCETPSSRSICRPRDTVCELLQVVPSHVRSTRCI